ncbi:helix-turn-helix domain-containing protein [Enterocloster citroniae]|nr:helix-turn-helix domain-containing protein [Enterocloster citroniae]
MVSQEYPDGLGSYEYLATKYQIGRTQLREWIAKYRQYGLN